MAESPHRRKVVVIGGGFTGLSAAYELARRGVGVVVLERDEDVGGLAGSFQVDGQRLEKFYHHWFTSDTDILELAGELASQDAIVYRPTRTGMYFANRFFRLSTPTDVLRFSPLSLWNRIRLGMLALRARTIGDWRKLESLTARQWLLRLCGREVFRVVWEPLLRGKFGSFASEVSAVWFWSKLKLRGGSRGDRGEESLAYYRGGFAALANRISLDIQSRGGKIVTGAAAESLSAVGNRITGVETAVGTFEADAVIATPALPIIADLVAPHVSHDYARGLRRIDYLGNICLVLELDRSLSETYWLNVNDPGFPFVGVIEHTNFEPPDSYGGRHIVYLSRYLPDEEPLFRASDDDVLDFCLPHLQRMFPEFARNWIQRYHVWRASYAQPIVVRHYSRLIPSFETPLAGFYIATMAQVYPEDRGTNYAVRDGRRAGHLVAETLGRNELCG